MLRQRLQVGRLPVDVMSFAEAVRAVEALVDAGRGGAVFTPNVDHVVQAETNDELVNAYKRADLSFADGTPIVWASRLLGPVLPERVAGSDLVLPVLAVAARRGWRVAFLGAQPGVARAAARMVTSTLGVNVVSVDSPMVNLDDTAQLDGIAAHLAAAHPHLVLMAFGAPKQELLIDKVLERVRPAVCMGIGASLDFIAGTVDRAPGFMRRNGLEWAFRLMQEPRRMWRRYLVNDPQFALIVGRSLVRRWYA